jgi:ribosome biogenesis protein Nip4
VRLLKKFLEGVGSALTVDEERLLRINNKRFTVGEELDNFIFRWDNLVYAGKLLGKDRKLFHPSPTLLQELASEQGPLNKVHVKEGKFEEGVLSLVMFDGSCLGYGRVESFQGKRILKNVFDIGDFLRRERWRT